MMHSFFSSPWRHNYFLSANTRISAETPRPSLPADLFTRPLPREVASYHILSSSKAQSPKDFSALVCRCVCISMTQDPGNVSASVQKKQEPRRCSLRLLPLLLLGTVCLFSTTVHFCLSTRHGIGREHSLGRFNPFLPARASNKSGCCSTGTLRSSYTVMALHLLIPVENFNHHKLHKSLQTFTAERLDPPLLANSFCLPLLLLLFGSLNGVVKLSDRRIHEGIDFLLNTSDTAPDDGLYFFVIFETLACQLQGHIFCIMQTLFLKMQLSWKLLAASEIASSLLQERNHGCRCRVHVVHAT